MDYSESLGSLILLSEINNLRNLWYFFHFLEKQRTIRRQKYSGNSTIGSGIVWQWMTEKGWVVYDIEAIDSIERAYNQGNPECDLGIGFLTIYLNCIIS